MTLGLNSAIKEAAEEDDQNNEFMNNIVCTSVPLSANLSMGMSAMIRAQSLNLLVGFE